MVPSAAGAVVLVPFPFSDLSQSKLRPAVELADAGRGDWILCQVTSKSYDDPLAVQIDQGDFAPGANLIDEEKVSEYAVLLSRCSCHH